MPTMTREPVVEVGAPADVVGFVEWVRPQLGLVGRLVGRLAVGAERDVVVQEALARAWSKRAQYDASRGTASGWLLSIVAEQALKAARRARSFGEFDEDSLLVSRPELDAQRDVDRALTSLTAAQRLAVDCYYFAGLSVGDTAAVMRCSEGAVKTTLVEARSRLRTLLEISE
jgi:RNA polymerase sigma-70 factor (ECF subfamily)